MHNRNIEPCFFFKDERSHSSWDPTFHIFFFSKLFFPFLSITLFKFQVLLIMVYGFVIYAHYKWPSQLWRYVVRQIAIYNDKPKLADFFFSDQYKEEKSRFRNVDPVSLIIKSNLLIKQFWSKTQFLRLSNVR